MVRSDFLTSKMAIGGHFLKNIYKKSCASDLNNVRTDCWPTTTWYKLSCGQYIYRQVCWVPGNIHYVQYKSGECLFMILVQELGSSFMIHMTQESCYYSMTPDIYFYPLELERGVLTSWFSTRVGSYSWFSTRVGSYSWFSTRVGSYSWFSKWKLH